eukprot:SM000065S20196  [mRNA]  locus=s65:232907:239639:- [translate_table: standard]
MAVGLDGPHLLGRKLRRRRGRPLPLGAAARDGGVNFAVPSAGALAVTLCLLSEADLQQGTVTCEIPLHPLANTTGDVWHIFLPNLSPDLLYGYRVDGLFQPKDGNRFDASKIIVDPYAKAVVSRASYGVPAANGNCWPQMAGMIPIEGDEFDWEGDSPPGNQQKDLVIYEVHTRGFTQHASSNVEHAGTFAGLVEKLHHLKELGVNALELMPIQEFNELEYYAYNPATGDHKVNFWGYSPVNYFSPMTRYAAAGTANCGRAAIREFKTLVREAHKLGIEVLIDVVFNHTAEGNEMGPTFSFRGLDNNVFYMIAPAVTSFQMLYYGEFYNYSGCGNTFNCNHPAVRNFIIDCLRYWAVEMRVDGFRFDLAAILTRSSSLWKKERVFGTSEVLEGDTVTTGTPLAEPPLIDMISNDPVLRSVKLIAEAWDAGGLYQVGSFPHWGIWSEWNGKFRDITRLFIKGTDGVVGEFAKHIAGSSHIYAEGGRKSWHGINFITSHDGFSLGDLVSYNEKHNLPNGEENADGESHNLSWNCGEEGNVAGIGVLRLRQRQMRNFMVALLVSQGVPMLTMGDEYGHTKGGNNNTYCHDSEVNYFQWDKKEADTNGFYRFNKLMIHFRRHKKCNFQGQYSTSHKWVELTDLCFISFRKTESFRLYDYPPGDRLQWHGITPGNPDWSESSRFLAFTIWEGGLQIYVAFNASHLPVMALLPGRFGFRKPSPYDFLADDVPHRATALAQSAALLDSNCYPILGYSSVILQQVLYNS